MPQKSLLAWLSEKDALWAWQTVLDTLAFGEGVPLRLIDARCLQNFHSCLRSICDDPEVQALIDVRPFGHGSLCKTFDAYFGSEKNFEKKIKTWVWRAEALREAIRRGTLPDAVRGKPVFSRKTLLLFDAAFPFFRKKFFKTLTANAIPLDFLSKLVMSYWRWYKLLWLYHEFMIRGGLEKDRRDGSWNVCEPAFEIPGLYFVWRRLATHPELLLLVGPVFGSRTASSHDMDHAATLLMEFQRRVEGSDSILIQEERFLRAAHAEPPVPLPNLTLSADRVIDALELLGTLNLPEQPIQLYSPDLRSMALWALFIQQQKKYLSLACQQYMSETDRIAVVLYRETASSAEMWGKSPFARITADAVELGTHERDGSPDLLPDDDGGSGFRLCLSESSLGEAASLELREELQLHFGRLFIDYHRHVTLFNNERLPIMNDRLQSHWVRLLSEDSHAAGPYANLAHRISARITELLRADITTLYDYETVEKHYGALKAIGMYFSDPFHRKYAGNLESEMQGISGTDDRHRSVCYRAIDDHRQKIIFDSDPKTGVSVPPDEPIYVPQGEDTPVFRGTIATPITFNDRLIALLEVNTLEPWMFRKAQLFSLQQIASALSPFLYQHRYLQALQGIQEAILRFHAKESREDKLYNDICKLLTGLFVCHGAAMWVRDIENTNRFIRKGSHNVERQHKQLDLGENKSFTEWCIEEFSHGGGTHHFNTNCEDTSRSVINREELLKAGIKTLTIVLISNDRREITAAITLYGKGDYEPYDAAWDGIMDFIGSYISLAVEAVNAFVLTQRHYEAVHVHELYHDAALIADKGKKLAHSMQGLQDGVKTFLDTLDDPRFREELNRLLPDMVGDTRLKALRNLPHQLNSSLFLVDKDLEYYSSTLLTRITTLFGKDSHNLPPKSEDFLQATGDVKLARSIDWDEEEKWVYLRDIYLSFREGNRRAREKGLFFDFDAGGLPHLEIFAPRTIITTVFRNLLTNAVKYSLSNEPVTITQKQTRGGSISLSIQSKGRSFDRPGEDLYILGPNHRGSNAEKIGREEEGGLGMGLYIVDQLCRHLLDIGFRFREEPKGGGVSMFHAELLFSENKVRYQYGQGFSG